MVNQPDALFPDQQNILQMYVQNVLGRAQECIEIRQLLRELESTGGYLIIHGQGGQGKSSIIAKLIDEYKATSPAYHFVHTTSARNQPVTLLHNLMDHLIRKHQLPDFSLRAVNKEVLGRCLLLVLREIAARGAREVIFIDGLDQLAKNNAGVSDLHFLPDSPPEGITFVLGMNYEKVSLPLKPGKSCQIYQLPALSRADFSLMLQRRHVSPETTLVDRFYLALQGNAFYLDLLARELAHHPEPFFQELFRQIGGKPENIFFCILERLKQSQTTWEMVLRPLLGILGTACEPLSRRQLRQILQEETDRLDEGLISLEDLLQEDTTQRISFFHPEICYHLWQNAKQPWRAFLFSIEERREWHARLVDWCTSENNNLVTLWEDVIPTWEEQDTQEQERREYARKYYCAHLYGADKWEQLLQVLDQAEYGYAKVRSGLGILAYMDDLDLGRRVVAEKKWSMEEAPLYLPRLWGYSLLCCRLNELMDHYPLSVFLYLIQLNRKAEALELLELTRDFFYKEKILHLIVQEFHEDGWPDVLKLYQKHTAKKKQGSNPGFTVVVLLTKARSWAEAREVTLLIEQKKERDQAWHVLGKALLDEHRWQEVREVIDAITDEPMRDRVREETGKALIEAEQYQDASNIIMLIENKDIQTRLLRALARAFFGLQKWQEAREVIGEIKSLQERDWALSELIVALARVQKWQAAREALSVIEGTRQRNWALRQLGTGLMDTQQWQEAEMIISEIDNLDEQDQVRVELGIALAGKRQWQQARRIINHIEDIRQYCWVSGEIGCILVDTDEAQAKHIWKEVRNTIDVMEDPAIRNQALRVFVNALTRAREWSLAKETIGAIEDAWLRGWALIELGRALVGAQEKSLARSVWHEVRNIIGEETTKWQRNQSSGALVHTLAAVGEWQEIKEIIDTIDNEELSVTIRLNLGKILIEEQKWQEAKELFNKIKDKEVRMWSLGRLGMGLANTQHWQEAIEIINTIEDVEIRGLALRDIANKLMSMQKWQEAEEYINSIEDPLQYSFAVREIGSAFARAGNWQEAIERVKGIEDSKQRDEALERQGYILIGAKEWPGAEQTIQTLEDAGKRDALLNMLVSKMGESGAYEQAFRIVQQSWYSADTTGCLLAYLQQLAGFISLRPASGLVCYQAYLAVERFVYEIENNKLL